MASPIARTAKRLRHLLIAVNIAVAEVGLDIKRLRKLQFASEVVNFEVGGGAAEPLSKPSASSNPATTSGGKEN